MIQKVDQFEILILLSQPFVGMYNHVYVCADSGTEWNIIINNEANATKQNKASEPGT